VITLRIQALTIELEALGSASQISNPQTVKAFGELHSFPLYTLRDSKSYRGAKHSNLMWGGRLGELSGQ